MMQSDLPMDDPIVQCVLHLSELYQRTYTIQWSKEWCHFVPLALEEKITQGWKLHLSVLPNQAVEMLETVSHIVNRYNIQWKVCASIEQLIAVTSPPIAITQVGKFMTIYPQDDEQAVELAEILHHKTCQFKGAIIPSDSRYKPDSQVYYRYGSFQASYFYDPLTSMKKFALLDDKGEKVEDKRAVGKSYPDWIANPFLASNSKEQRVDRKDTGFLGKELRIKGVLRQTAKGGTYVVAKNSETFILKEARFGTCPDGTGRDARDQLTNEYTLLTKLHHLHIAPEPIEIFDVGQNRYLLMEHLTGHNLRSHIEKANYFGGYETTHLRDLCQNAIELVRQCHDLGIVLRDFTPNNILVTPEGCKLLDFELGYALPDSHTPFRGFTPGYTPHGMTRLTLRNTPIYDRYALGAVLFFILTGLDPYLGFEVDILPRKHLLLELFAPAADLDDLIAYTEELLTWPHEDTQQRPLAILPGYSVHQTSDKRQPGQLSFTWDDLEANATALAHNLYETADWQNETFPWPEHQKDVYTHPACFQMGTAGIAYFFIEMAECLGDAKYITYAKRLIDWTLETHPFEAGTVPVGLYFGYAAIPWVQSLIASKSSDQVYLQQSLLLANSLSASPLIPADITHGKAGIGLLHLHLYHLTDNQEQLQRAISLGHQLINTAEEDRSGNIFWPSNDAQMWGFAHGTAGIASFLLALYKQTGETSLKTVGEKCASTLIQAAVPVRDPRGLIWPQGPDKGQSTVWTHWCNGATGVGHFFLDAAQTLHNPDFERMAIAAGYAVSTGRTIGSCGQCHGLAGNGDYLLRVGRSLAQPELEDAAYEMAEKLWVLRIQRDTVPGWTWYSEQSYAPAYMTGDCGIYSFLFHLFQKTISQTFLQS